MQDARRSVLKGLGLAAAAAAVGTEAQARNTTDSGRAGRNYEVYDVFTETALTGNPVAVFVAPNGLTGDTMMAMTREINYSECTFVFPASQPGCDFQIRFFAMNSGSEIPIAGHPTLGTVFSLAARGKIAPGRKSVTLQLGVGPTPIDLEWHDGRLAFAWMRQQPPEMGGALPDRASAAAALGLTAEDLADFPVQQVSCGAPFLMMPVKTRAAVDRAQLDRAALGRMLDATGLIRRGVLIFSLEDAGDDATAYSRMLGFGVTEDAATGNASGPLGAYLVTHGIVPLAKAGRMISRQGVRMKRPSRIYISVTGEAPDNFTVWIGGNAVKAAEGVMLI